MYFFADEPGDFVYEPGRKGYKKFHKVRNTLCTFIGI